MIASLAALSPHLRERLANALEVGLLPSGCSATAVRSVLDLRTGSVEVHAGLSELENLGISGGAEAAWLKALDHVGKRASMPDLVWSGPELPGIPARDTRRVYEELLRTAQVSLWVSTFAYFDGPRVFEDLARRIDEVPGLQVTLLLNIGRRWGDTTKADGLVRRFADEFWEWTGPGRRDRGCSTTRARSIQRAREVCFTPRPSSQTASRCS